MSNRIAMVVEKIATALDYPIFGTSLIHIKHKPSLSLLVIVILAVLSALTPQAALGDCPSRASNLNLAKKHLNDLVAELQSIIDRFEECDKESKAKEGAFRMSGMGDADPARPIEVEEDDAGQLHVYEVNVNSVGEETGRTEIRQFSIESANTGNDATTIDETTSGDAKSESDNTDLISSLRSDLYRRNPGCMEVSDPDWLASKDMGFWSQISFAQALVDNIDQIPCDVIIDDIRCYANSGMLTTCELKIKLDNSMRAESNGKASANESRLKNLYDAIGRSMARKQSASAQSALASLGEGGPVSGGFQTGGVLSSDQPKLTPLSRMSDIVGDRGVDIDGSTIITVSNSDGTTTTYHDDDENDTPDWISVERPNGTSTLFVDTDHDGIFDKRTEIGADGKPVYSDMGKNESGSTSGATVAEPPIPSYGLTPDPSISKNDVQIDTKSAAKLSASESRPTSLNPRVNDILEFADMSRFAWLVGQDGTAGIPLDLDHNGNISGVAVKNGDNWDIYIDDNGDQMANFCVELSESDASLWNVRNIEPHEISSDVRPALPQDVNFNDYAKAYSAYMSASTIAEQNSISNDEIKWALLKISVEEPLKKAAIGALEGEIVGAGIDALKLGDVAKGSYEIYSAYEDIRDALTKGLEVLDRDVERNDLISFYKSDLGKVNLDGFRDEWSKAQVQQAAEQRADRFLSFVRAREKQWKAYEALMGLYGNR